MASVVADLLFEKQSRFDRLKAAVHSLSHDRFIAVRACAPEPLLAMLNIDTVTAITWFKECVTLDPVLLSIPPVEQFLHFAADRDYPGIQPVLDAMLNSDSEKVIEAGARQICLAALDDDSAKADAERVRNGSPLMRKAGADVYSTNAANSAVGATCRQLLKPFFADADEAVRAEAASVFRHLADLTTEMQADLLIAFLDAKQGPNALKQVVLAMTDSPVQLPDLVCKLAEQCVEAFRNEASDISKAGSMVAMNLSKIVIRLYTQTNDKTIQSRCLTLMDEMERHHFMGLSDELRRLDR